MFKLVASFRIFPDGEQIIDLCLLWIQRRYAKLLRHCDTRFALQWDLENRDEQMINNAIL